MIAVVCVYNNKKVFDEYLLKSLQMQTARFQLIALDNSTGAFSSAAQALNHGARSVHTDSAYIMFAHQDISFRSTRWLENVESQLNALPSLGLAGVAGNNEREKRLISNITYGMPPRSDGKRIDAPLSVMTVDECCAIIPREVFKRRPFDEETCNNWHLYVVEYCLHLKTLGLEAYVLPLDLYHVSTTGSLNSAYFSTLQKVLMRYKSAYKKIYTSSGCWDTATPVMGQRLSYYAKKIFYGFSRWLIATGFVPARMLRKKRKRLQQLHQDRYPLFHPPHMTQKPLAAIIILNWNGFDDTIECLQSLRQLTYPQYKIVLVDNGSANNEGRRIKESFSEIHLIENTMNRGFAGGCNDGINWAMESGFDYIITLNNDCLVEPDWLTNLIAGLMAAGADFGSSRIMYYPETDLICSNGDGLLPDGTGYVLNPLQPFQGPGEIQPIFSACGASAIFSRKSLEAVKIKGRQFFDELFFAYFEDIDLGARLHALGYVGVCVPDAVVYHKESKAAGTRSFFKIYQSEKNRILVELLNFPLWLILIGELYYCTRTVSRNVAKCLPLKHQNRMRPLPSKAFSPWNVLVTSRWWIIRNFSKIRQGRRERKSKGLISGSICKWLCWDIRRLLSIKQ